jgi:murein DD-endopeptidase MepM/ murein hydrolase activator NlpD
VRQGEQIAESGSTGNSTGDHLDFRIRQEGAGFLDPQGFLP